MCKLHYQRVYRTGHTGTSRKPAMKPGETVGVMTLLEITESGKHSRGIFRCVCGTVTKAILIHHVQHGTQKSCGCIRAATPRGPCRVEGCDSQAWHLGESLCVAHYKRFRKHGDPTAGGIPHGAAQRFIAKAIASDTDECVLFPYYRDDLGYARATIDGRSQPVHGYVIRKTKGPKPSPKHETCHSCGHGNLGCINPRHLYWGTRSDNVRDAIRHGTFGGGHVPLRGEAHPRSKLTRAIVDQVRARLAAGGRQIDIAAEFGMTQPQVSAIKLRKIWAS